MDIPNQIKSPRKREYSVKEKVYEGDVADFYACESSNGPALLKVARDRQDNDLLENEAGILGILYPPRAKDEKFYRYLPRLADSFLLTEDKSNRRVSVLPNFDEYLTLEQIIKAYPKGIDFRDMVWMYKRLLVAIGFAHTQGIIHGAILPSHVLVHPTEHGAKVIAWSYALNFAPPPKTADPDPVLVDPKKHSVVARSVWDRVHDSNLYDDGSHPTASSGGAPQDPNRMYVKAISVTYDKFYPSEILQKQTPTPATDVYMAAKCAIALLGGDPETNIMPDTVPPQIQAFLSGNVLGSPRKRPQDAWDVHEDFDKLLLRLVGKPTYRPFAMPA